MALPGWPLRYFNLNAGVPVPGVAMLAANARAQAPSAVFSAEARETQGKNAAIEAAPRMRVRKFMMVFLVEKIPTPHTDPSSRRPAEQTRNFLISARFVSCICGLPQTRRTSRDSAFAQDPARQLLQVLARAILRPVQEVVAFIRGQFGFE